MHRFWNFFIERKQFTVLVMVALVTMGTAAVVAIPKENAPEVEVPVAVIRTTMRGASALDIAKLVTKEIEKEVGNVENIDTLSSSSREGISLVTAEFEASADLDKSIQDVKDAVDRAQASLPRDADDPVVTRVSFSDQPILIISLSSGLAPVEFAQLAEKVKDELELVPGVSSIDIAGTRDRQASVVVQRETLASYGLSLSDVVAAIGASNSQLPIGSITVNDIEYAVAFKGTLEDPEELTHVTVGNLNGTPIYLQDIADIVNGIEKATTISRVSIEGAPAEQAITLSVHKKVGGNIFSTSQTVKDKLDSLSGTLLVGVSSTVSIDLGEEVSKSLGELVQVGIETIILVMLCLLLTIGWRESVVAGLSIPLSFVVAFSGLYISGNTINFVSLFSLILAIGILVDSGIVVTEAIHTRYKKFGNPMVAAKESIREYAWPLTAGTMTTVAMFAPLFFISGITGEFIASIPFTIICVLIASIFVALGFVPLIAIMFTKRSVSTFEARQEEWNMRAQAWYRTWLSQVLANRKFQRRFLWGMPIALVIAFMLPISGLVNIIFFPQEDTEYAYLEIETKQGTPLLETDLATRAVEELLYNDQRIESFVTTIGASSGLTGNATGGARYGNITIRLVPPEDRKTTSTEFVEELRTKLRVFRTFSVRAYEPQGGPPTGAPVVITFSGENLDDLERAIDMGENVLTDIEGATEITSSIKDDGTQFALSIDRAKAAEAGLSPAAVASILRTAVSGSVATTIKKDNEDIDVVVSTNLNPEWEDPSETTHVTVEALMNFPVKTTRGTILLGSMLSSAIEKSNNVIRREDQKNIATISSYLTGDNTATDVSSAFETAMKEKTLPTGVSMNIGGETEDVDQSFREMFFALVAGMVLMLAILVLMFNSFRYSFYLLMLVPLSLIGVFAGLALTREPLSFPSLLGVIALAGVIINHAIILVDSIVVRMKNPEGKTLSEVVVDGAVSRLRPIILTTITTVIGMVPLASASGLWGPLAFSIMFGLTFAMILTLILTPILVYRHPGKQFWNVEKEERIQNPI